MKYKSLVFRQNFRCGTKNGVLLLIPVYDNVPDPGMAAYDGKGFCDGAAVDDALQKASMLDPMIVSCRMAP